jgi:hypothetical protein
MEDVLETYQKPRDPDRPLVCLDETSKQLIVETRAPIPAKPGRAVRPDYEYERNGVANIFMMFAPLEGWRQVKVPAPEARRLAKRFEWHSTPKTWKLATWPNSNSASCRAMPQSPNSRQADPPTRERRSAVLSQQGITQRPTGNSPQTTLA